MVNDSLIQGQGLLHKLSSSSLNLSLSRRLIEGHFSFCFYGKSFERELILRVRHRHSMKTCTPYTAVRMMQVDKFSLLVSYDDVSYTETCGLTYAKWREREKERKVHASLLYQTDRHTHVKIASCDGNIRRVFSGLETDSILRIEEESQVEQKVKSWQIKDQTETWRNKGAILTQARFSMLMRGRPTPTTRLLSSRQGWRMKSQSFKRSFASSCMMIMISGKYVERSFLRVEIPEKLLSLHRLSSPCRWKKSEPPALFSQRWHKAKAFLESTHVVNCGVLVGDEFVYVSP